MKAPRTHLLRRALLGVVIVVAGAVAWNLLHTGGPPPEEPPGEAAPVEGTSVGDLSFFRFRGGEQKVQVNARSMSGEEGGPMRLEGVEVVFPFTARGEESKATITSDECLYDASREKARFRGNVHVVTEDGFELDTDQLTYDGHQGRVESNSDLRFRQGRASGRARGLVYNSAQDQLQLKSDVHLRFEDPDGGPATEVESQKARASRKTRIVRFQGEAVVVQGDRSLRSNRLQLTLDPELQSIVRAVAIGSVDARLSPGTLPGENAAAGGERRLTCGRLDIDFRGPGVLEEALAARHATLAVSPGPRDPPERRRIEASSLRFLFDERGQLETLRGGSGRASGEGRRARRKDRKAEREDRDSPRVVLTTEPLPPSKAHPRRVECARLEARVEASTGDVQRADLEGDVTYVEDARHAWSQKARYDRGAEALTLTGGGPRIVDEDEGSELQAETIRIGTEKSSIRADGGVRHTIGPRGGGADGRLLGGTEPTLVVSGHLDYDPEARTARYRDNVLLRSGKDEIRAPELVLEEPEAGRRRLVASGGTSSLLHPRPRKGKEKGKDEPATGAQAPAPAPVETRSREMVYEEKAGTVVYTGDVEIRQGDIVTMSPRAVVTLTPGGDDVDRMVAGEPVEVRQGTRRATGRTGTYTLADETLVLVGDEVVLQDKDRQVKGRALTFKVGEDRIRVDGREQERTEAVFKKDTPQR